MEQHPDVLNHGIQRASGEVTPFNAGDAVAAVIDMYGMPIPSTHRARLGKAAKELLGDGFEPNLVCAAMLTAVQMARPDMVQSFTLEFQNAQSGNRMDWKDYRERLRQIEANASPELQAIYRTLEEAFR